MKQRLVFPSLLLAVAVALGGGQLAEAASAQSCPVPKGELDQRDMEIAKVAWQYFVRNTRPETGFANAVDNYPSTTMWDTGSALAAIVTARSLGLIDQKEMDARVTQMLTTLEFIQMFDGELPNKVYNTKNAMMVNYANKPSEKGIGVSSLDLGRLASWLNILSCLHPHHQAQAQRIMESWNYCLMIRNGQMYGLAWNETKTKSVLLQEGRLGYEQYAAKVFKMLGFDQSVSSHYRNQFSTNTTVNGVSILIDKRDAMNLGANNYVVAESYAMDAKEHGFDDENTPLVENIYRVQEARWKETKIVTAVSEDNIDRRPYFVYNTIFANGEPWAAITDMGEDFEELKSTSVKAAMSMAYLFPDRPYSKVLMDRVWEARNPKGGWYSGIYEDHKGFNKATTANTNGVILSLMLSKMYGPLNKHCTECNKGARLGQSTVDSVNDLAACAARRPERLKAHAIRMTKGRKILDERLVEVRAQQRIEAIDEIAKLATAVAGYEQQAKSGKGADAGAALKAIKSTVWKMSTDFQAEQKALRKLMGPIDLLSGKWASGNAASSQDLQAKLKAVAQRLKAAG